MTKSFSFLALLFGLSTPALAQHLRQDNLSIGGSSELRAGATLTALSGSTVDLHAATVIFADGQLDVAKIDGLQSALDAKLAAATAATTYQPLDADLTSIAALATTSFGRGLLTQADAAALRSTAGLVIGTDVLAPAGNGSALTGLTWSQLGGTPTTLTGYGITDAVPSARTLTATAPLTIDGLSGASDLSANHTLAVSAATTSAAGVLRLATSAEATTGTDTATALSPATGAAAITAAVQPLAATRAPVDWFYNDGVTGGRKLFAALGSAGHVTGSPVTFAGFFVRFGSTSPTSSAPAYIFGLSMGTDVNPGATNTLIAYLQNNALIIAETGASNADYRQIAWSGFFGAYAGQLVGLTVSFTRGTATPTVWLWSAATGWLDVSSHFNLSTGGTPPDWMDGSLATNYFVAGRQLQAEFHPGVLINRAWTQTDMDYLASTGRMPPQDELGGSQIGLSANPDLATDATGWTAVLTGATGSTAGRNTTDPVAGSADYELDYLGTGPGGGYPRVYGGVGPIYSGHRYAYTITIQRVSGSGNWRLYDGDSNSAQSRLLTLDGTVQTFTGTFIGNVGTIASPSAMTLMPDTLAANAPACELRVVNWQAWQVGEVAAFDVGWTAQARGKYNGIHGTLMAGASPLHEHDDLVQIISGSLSATGYVLGFSGPHVFRDYKIEKIEVRPTTATVPDVTLRRNATTGGTPIVSAVSAGTQGAWTSLPITGGTEDGSAGDYFHITLSTAAALDYRLTLSRR